MFLLARQDTMKRLGQRNVIYAQMDAALAIHLAASHAVQDFITNKN